MLHTLGGGVGSVEGLGVVVSGSVGGVGSGNDGVDGSESGVAWSVDGLGGCGLMGYRGELRARGGPFGSWPAVLGLSSRRQWRFGQCCGQVSLSQVEGRKGV